MILNLVFPGIGHLYAKKFLQGIIIILLTFVVLCVFFQWLDAYSVSFIFTGLKLASSFLCYSQLLGNQKSIYGYKWFGVIIGLLILNYGVKFATKYYWVDKAVLRNDAECMFPTLRPSDRIIIDKTAYRHTLPQIGDIIAYKFNYGPSGQNYTLAVKRVVAIHGEQVLFKNNALYVNGVLRYSYDKNANLYPHGQDILFGISQDYVVPKNGYFLVGDNYVRSYDSRHYDAIPQGDILGKVVKIIWPPSRATILLREKGNYND